MSENTVRDLTTVAMEGRKVGDNDYVVLPNEYHIRDLDSFQVDPRRNPLSVKLDDEASFLAVVNRFKLNHSLIYAKRPGRDGSVEIIAVFDHQENSVVPHWGESKATLSLATSVEWGRWSGKNGAFMSQAEFADFLDTNAKDVTQKDGVGPTQATMIEIARSITGKKEISFGGGHLIENGAIQFQYTENVRGSTTNGNLEIPTSFYIGVSPFYRGPKYSIQVKFRWRLNEGALQMRYDLVDPHVVFEDAYDEITARIATETSLAVLRGTYS